MNHKDKMPVGSLHHIPQFLSKKNWHGFQIPIIKIVNMEMRNENSKRRRKVVQSQPVLVRSVKPGQATVQSWERKSSALSNMWNAGTTAA